MEPLDLPRTSSGTYRHASPAEPNITSFKRPSGIPPTHPNPHYSSSQIPPPSPVSAQPVPTHSRSLSQPPFFSLDSLPPLNPTSISPNPSPRVSLPPRKAHRRSHSDVPLGFTAPPPVKQETSQEMLSTDDLVSAYMNFENMEMLNSSEASGTKDSSENEAESSSINETGASSGLNEQKREGSGHKRGATGEPLAPVNPRHCRSLSMDSFMGRLNFGEDSPKLGPVSPGIPSPGNQSSGGHSRSGSMDGAVNPFGADFGAGEFNEAEIKKIKANEKLVEMAVTDPKRVKRILANRLSAARSKERKMRYISELESKVLTLQNEATTLSAQLTLLQRDSTGLVSQNNELKIRLQAMEQQAHLRDALNEALTAEVKRLKLATGEISDSSHPKVTGGMNNHHPYSLSSQMLQQMQQMHLQQQQQQVQLQEKQQKPRGPQQQQEV
ncbi:Basic-leucine zipper (bZIP) transcription factor family protein [Rhynchospora pubera]|uniref:Basic-leucine zipper (BZIP) transcription factor family protein n=1 Tax=Rhynchospora pubera TaxID=906938 RepID=A0AAV8EEB0_9POAL|nr:Basic-leucine zipper (bZIP) transcription factor family protein [Rhynchospora pubera]